MPEFYIGLMSGTSLDGVDAALVDFSGSTPQVVATQFLSYPQAIRSEALSLNSVGADELHRAANLGNAIAALYANAVRQILERAKIPAAGIEAIGAHGQTVRHRPELGYTIQLCNASALAEGLGIRVVADFRSRDIAASGQGAPLVPAFHAAYLRSDSGHRVILNIGGIANITDLPPRGPIKGFDTGPGNLLLDAWCERHTGQRFDAGGDWARTGRCNEALLSELLQEPYFQVPPPKSTGRDLFNEQWLGRFKLESYRPPDVQATLLECTARSIANAIQHHCAETEEIYVCGGGAANGLLIERLRANLPALLVSSTAELGLDPDWVEAVAFAWLARQTINGQPGNLPDVTGAQGPRILGAIHPA